MSRFVGAQIEKVKKKSGNVINSNNYMKVLAL